MPTASAARRSPRLGSSAKRFRRCSSRTVLWWASKAFQAGRAVSDWMRAVMFVFLSQEIRNPRLGFRLSVISVRSWRFFLPKPKPSQERIGVVARTAMPRQLFQFLHVPSPQDHIIGFEGSDQEGDHVRYIFAPLLFAVLIESANAHVVLIGALLIRQMAQLHRLNDAVQNHGGTQTRSQAQEQHLAALVAPQSLHGRIIDQLDRAPERCSIVEPHPTRGEVMLFRN